MEKDGRRSSETPVLILAFNRPHLISKLVCALRQEKPAVIYFAQDGPRFGSDSDPKLCAKTRAALKGIDWDCSLRTLIASENMGTKRRLTTAVEHVLRENSSVIILEDDCIPTNGFIRWASNRMAVFKDHTGIGMVSGNRFDFQAETCTLSKFPRTWGWGTTRESWRGFQPDKAMDKEELKQIIATNVKNPFARRHWFRRYLEAVQDKHMWDVQWTIHLWGKNKSTLIPPQNLVSNQGGGADATHTFNSSIFLDWPTTPQINPKESKFHLLKDESSRQGVEPLLLRLEVVIGILSKSGASALARRLALSIRTIVSGPID